MSGRRRALAAAVAIVAGMAPLLGPVAPPATALTHPAVTIGEGEALERTYPIVAGNNPANAKHDPETCKTSLYCDVIRLTIKPPSDPDVSYFVRVQMFWTTQFETDTPAVGEVTNNDMDMYIYYVPYNADADPEENQAGSGATGAQPETAYVDPAGDYDVVVVNFLGVNEAGYRLTFTYVTETDFTPLELLEDHRRPVVDTSGEAVAGPTGPSLPSLGPSPFIQPPIDLNPLTNFDDPFGLGRPISSVSQRAGDILRRADEQAAIAAAKPVSAATAIFWLVAFPLLLVGLAGAFFMRRRSTSLRLDA